METKTRRRGAALEAAILTAAWAELSEVGYTDLTIEAVAKRAGVTARTLESIFRKSIGETPGAYYLRLRLGAARRLVVDTRVAMADIAGRAGFSSAAAFSRAFSRAFGEAPVRLRRG